MIYTDISEKCLKYGYQFLTKGIMIRIAPTKDTLLIPQKSQNLQDQRLS